MELHHRPCVVPSNAPAKSDRDYQLQLTVLQERSANRQRVHATGSTRWKRPPSTSTENWSTRGPAGGSYFTSDLANQWNGENSEAQIEAQIEQETDRLLGVLQRSDKYLKYREKQPRNAKEKDTVWPPNLERAFFKGLVRWPPMGRRKLMLDGELRGRNELVAISIFRDTGEDRDRKKVSSHIQVLKEKLFDQPEILAYMAKTDSAKRKNRSAHVAQLRSRHHSSAQSTKYAYTNQPSSEPWSGYGAMPSDVTLASMRCYPDSDAAFTVTDFGMIVKNKNKERFHTLTQLADPAMLGALNITDVTTWHKQYPELEFHQTDDFKDRQVLVCDASIKLMTQPQPQESELFSRIDLTSQADLSLFESFQYRTRFHDNGKVAIQVNEEKQVREVLRQCEYEPETGRVEIPFGSNFWVHRIPELSKKMRIARMAEESEDRSAKQAEVRKSLQSLTAVQDVYGVHRDTGEAHCFLTILWRFDQTRSSNDAGKMTWRVVNFAPDEQRWMKTEMFDAVKESKALLNGTTAMAPVTLYPSLGLDFAQNPFSQEPPPLDLDMALEGMTDFSQPNSAIASSMATDFSQAHSLPSLTHSQDPSGAQSQDFYDANDFDFNGGHISIAGCLEPPINLGAYETYSHAPSLTLNPIVGLGHDHTDSPFGDLGLGGTMPDCYSAKPAWHHPDLVPRLEGVAEQTHGILDHVTHGSDIAGHGVLHDGQLAHGLWKLQSAFADDTGVGADGRPKDEALSQDQSHGALQMMDRDVGARDDRFTLY
ncbi:TEA/ATTS domain family-domain-containing protein [Massariosphaeria phaeospora]|uniref:TEA/ATTS domain family-domain-containing protein n=1 Tax=Massariosphaeria phaeospora TaxID=100035 RepID=A0A7C8I1X5_9PLEO|nr:TEA/ATTS domain family-domain-containing protein [Massariosphaeria phaeospora]